MKTKYRIVQKSPEWFEVQQQIPPSEANPEDVPSWSVITTEPDLKACQKILYERQMVQAEGVAIAEIEIG